MWRSLRRRWYLVLALAVLTVGATFLVAQRTGETYEATGTVLVFPPSQTEGPTGDMSEENPYLSLGGVGQARDVVVRALTSKKVGDEFGDWEELDYAGEYWAGDGQLLDHESGVGAFLAGFPQTPSARRAKREARRSLATRQILTTNIEVNVA